MADNLDETIRALEVRLLGKISDTSEYIQEVKRDILRSVGQSVKGMERREQAYMTEVQQAVERRLSARFDDKLQASIKQVEAQMNEQIGEIRQALRNLSAQNGRNGR